MKTLTPPFVLLVAPLLAMAGNVLHPGTPVLDRPTLTALGVQLPITGDDNYNATVTVRFHETGSTTWTDAQPLFRPHPDTTLPWVIAPQFAGSIFDLKPATSYVIELHATDPDGPVDQMFTIGGTTRALPGDPPNPRVRNVTDANSLNQAVGSAQPGDIISLANGYYQGPFSLTASGTAGSPIVIGGVSQDGVVLDGAGCTDCNIVELYGGYVHLEQMTLQNGQRAIRFQRSRFRPCRRTQPHFRFRRRHEELTGGCSLG